MSVARTTFGSAKEWLQVRLKELIDTLSAERYKSIQVQGQTIERLQIIERLNATLANLMAINVASNADDVKKVMGDALKIFDNGKKFYIAGRLTSLVSAINEWLANIPQSEDAPHGKQRKDLNDEIRKLNAKITEIMDPARKNPAFETVLGSLVNSPFNLADNIQTAERLIEARNEDAGKVGIEAERIMNAITPQIVSTLKKHIIGLEQALAAPHAAFEKQVKDYENIGGKNQDLNLAIAQMRNAIQDTLRTITALKTQLDDANIGKRPDIVHTAIQTYVSLTLTPKPTDITSLTQHVKAAHDVIVRNNAQCKIHRDNLDAALMASTSSASAVSLTNLDLRVQDKAVRDRLEVTRAGARIEDPLLTTDKENAKHYSNFDNNRKAEIEKLIGELLRNEQSFLQRKRKLKEMIRTTSLISDQADKAEAAKEELKLVDEALASLNDELLAANSLKDALTTQAAAGENANTALDKQRMEYEEALQTAQRKSLAALDQHSDIIYFYDDDDNFNKEKHLADVYEMQIALSLHVKQAKKACQDMIDRLERYREFLLTEENTLENRRRLDEVCLLIRQLADNIVKAKNATKDKYAFFGTEYEIIPKQDSNGQDIDVDAYAMELVGQYLSHSNNNPSESTSDISLSSFEPIHFTESFFDTGRVTRTAIKEGTPKERSVASVHKKSGDNCITKIYYNKKDIEGFDELDFARWAVIEIDAYRDVNNHSNEPIIISGNKAPDKLVMAMMAYCAMRNYRCLNLTGAGSTLQREHVDKMRAAIKDHGDYIYGAGKKDKLNEALAIDKQTIKQHRSDMQKMRVVKEKWRSWVSEAETAATATATTTTRNTPAARSKEAPSTAIVESGRPISSC